MNGDVGRHGMAIMAVREGLEFESEIESDSAPVAEVVLQLLRAGIEIHCLRDLTRGGLTSVLNEIAESADRAIYIEEKLVPVREDVRAACEIFGLKEGRGTHACFFRGHAVSWQHRSRADRDADALPCTGKDRAG